MSWSLVLLQVPLALSLPLYPILQCDHGHACSVEDPTLLGLSQEQLEQQLQLIPLEEPGALLGRKTNKRRYLFSLSDEVK